MFLIVTAIISPFGVIKTVLKKGQIIENYVFGSTALDNQLASS